MERMILFFCVTKEPTRRILMNCLSNDWQVHEHVSLSNMPKDITNEAGKHDLWILRHFPIAQANDISFVRSPNDFWYYLLFMHTRNA